jgi:O-antigen/teichoic acid export membrane protein
VTAGGVAPAGDASAEGSALTRTQVRGSSLLLVGRVLSMGLNFVTQVLIVRTLTKTEFGAFAYALSIASFAEPLITLGLHRGASRFLSIYDERRDYGRLLGTLILGVTTILSLGLAVTLVVVGLGDALSDDIINDRSAIALLGILILLAPVDALDGLVESVFAVFARPKAIFVRKHVVAPGMRLAVVALLVLSQRDAEFLAVGYVVAGAGGLVFYGLYLLRLLRERGLLKEFRSQRLVIPVREVLGFTIPLLSVDLVFLFITTSSTLILGYYSGVAAVAAYQAVLAPARLNYRIVTSSFTLLYNPAAARLHARGDRVGIGALYWQTTAWIAVLSAPVFMLTFAFAEPMTRLLYGSRYASAAPVMALLALGYYINAALGFNAHTLQVIGRVRTVLYVNLACAALNLVATFVLVRAFDAVGAAAATASTLVVQNLLNQLALARHAGVRLVEPAAARVYLRILVAVALLGGIQLLFGPPIVVGMLLSGVAATTIVRACRDDLEVTATFPEILKLPGARVLLGRDQKG